MCGILSYNVYRTLRVLISQKSMVYEVKNIEKARVFSCFSPHYL